MMLPAWIRPAAVTALSFVAIVVAIVYGLSGGPVRAQSSDPWDSISASGNTTCARTVGGAVFCWGLNYFGEVGAGPSPWGQCAVRLGATTSSSYDCAPYPVKVMDDAIAIDVGEYAVCALDRKGQAYCWGHNVDGVLGDGTTTNSPWPIQVKSSVAFTSISVGSGTACGTSLSGLYCWGLTLPRNGGLALTPTFASPQSFLANASVGDGFVCANAPIMWLPGVTWNAVACLGENRYGQMALPSSSTPFATTAILTGFGTDVVRVEANGSTTCVESTKLYIRCAGLNARGVFGQPSPSESSTPIAVPGAVRGVALGSGHACALDARDRLVCWGDWQPVHSIGGPKAPRYRAVAVGLLHACAIGMNDRIYCWGDNAVGQLGIGNPGDGTIAPSVPVVETR